VTNLVGGLRAIMIHDSLVHMVEDSLAALGWFDPTVYDTPAGTRTNQPLHFIPRPADWQDKVLFNSYAISTDDVTDHPAEIGSDLTEDTRLFTIDLYCEDDHIGTHLKDDVRDILRGKIPSIGRTGPVLQVFDYSQPTPPVVFSCDIDNVVADRAHNFPKAWQQHWWSIRCDVVDTYGDELYA
jgi:hypothetical protein